MKKQQKDKIQLYHIIISFCCHCPMFGSLKHNFMEEDLCWLFTGVRHSGQMKKCCLILFFREQNQGSENQDSGFTQFLKLWCPHAKAQNISELGFTYWDIPYCPISLRQRGCWKTVGLQCLPLRLPFLLRGSPTPLSPGHHCSTGQSAGLQSNMTGNKTLWCHWGQTMTKSTLSRFSRGFSLTVCLVSA